MPSLSPHPKPCWDAQGWRRPEGHFQPLAKVSVLCPGWVGPKSFGSQGSALQTAGHPVCHEGLRVKQCSTTAVTSSHKRAPYPKPTHDTNSSSK